jgi:hypothetical protein
MRAVITNCGKNVFHIQNSAGTVFSVIPKYNELTRPHYSFMVTKIVEKSQNFVLSGEKVYGDIPKFLMPIFLKLQKQH